MLTAPRGPQDNYGDRKGRECETSPADEKAAAPDGLRVEMGGLIAQKTQRATRQGQLMGIFGLEDLYGVTEVLAFPKVYESAGMGVNEGDALKIKGRLSARDGKAPNLIMESFEPMLPDAQAKTQPGEAPKQEKPRKLFLKLGRDKLDAVSFILATTPGNIKVNFFFPEEGKNFVAPSDLWVSPDFDENALRSLLGNDAVVLK